MKNLSEIKESPATLHPGVKPKGNPTHHVLTTPIVQMKGISKAKAKKLNYTNARAAQDFVKTIAPLTRLTTKSWVTMQKNLPTYLSPSTPPPLDHHEVENP